MPKYLYTIAFGSEVFSVKELKKWQNAVPQATFFNLYGPTECTGMSCFYKVDREFVEGDVIPIGKAFKNTEILLIDDDNKIAKNGEQGEICIRGTSLTFGYINDEERTDASFVQNPLNTSYKELIYRTGDVGKLNEYGELLFVSRKDYQIKHLGHRIELGEIESATNAFDNITNTACIYDSKNQRIVLFYAGEISVSELKNTLKNKLPKYMLPSKVIKLDEIPLTNNGKIDRVLLNTIYSK